MTIQTKLPDSKDSSGFTVGDFMTHVFAPGKFTPLDKELFETKWWDYRFMTPFEATLAYIDAFGVEARKIYARDIDVERAEHIHVVSSNKIIAALTRNEKKAKQSFAGFWRGRQVADAIGMPYSIYIHEALSQRMRRWQRVYLPSAQQIYQDGDVERVVNRWEEIKASRIYYSDHHSYLAQNYTGAPIQKAYCDYLFARVPTGSDRLRVLADMIEADRISLEYLYTEHGEIHEQVRAFLR